LHFTQYASAILDSFLYNNSIATFCTMPIKAFHQHASYSRTRVGGTQVIHPFFGLYPPFIHWKLPEARSPLALI
jgi:hypothetical protein